MKYTQIDLFGIMEQENEILRAYKKENARLTAITRNCHNVPYVYFLENKVITEKESILDYGCGKGFDVENLKENGYNIEGFDLYQENYNTPALITPDKTYEVVTCNYVINVVENDKELIEVIKNVYALAKNKACFSVRMDNKAIKKNWIPTLNGGWITPRKTYQKFYDQESFYTLIKTVLGVKALKNIQWFGNKSKGFMMVINK